MNFKYDRNRGMVDLDEEMSGFYRELNELLKMDTRDEYYIIDEVFGYGIEIEVSAKVARTHFVFLKTMIENIIKVINYRGNFVTDRTILGDYGFEICLDPLAKEECIEKYFKIREIIDFSSGILEASDEKNCGLHINIKASDRTKAARFKELFEILDENDHETFSFNEFKKLYRADNYDDYLAYQKEISAKYLAINYLKDGLIELRCINPQISKAKYTALLDKLEALFNV
jgi:hypothetical protein